MHQLKKCYYNNKNNKLMRSIIQFFICICVVLECHL